MTHLVLPDQLGDVPAAMEPAEYRPDDDPGDGLPVLVYLPPQWSRPSMGRMTVLAAADLMSGQPAAMEPAEYRPDDVQSGVTYQGTQSPPQWSRPSIGRMTGRSRNAFAC